MMSSRLLKIGLLSTLLLLPAVRADESDVKPPTIDPLPAGWKHGADTDDRHFGENAELKAYFDTTAAEKTGDFEKWCKKMREKEIKASPIVDEKDTELKAEKIGDYAVMTYDATGTLTLLPVHSRLYFVELPGSYARLNVNSMEESWGKIEGELDELVKKMK